MKKWLFPIACSFVSVIAFLLSGVVGIFANGDGTGYGGIVIVLCGLIFYCVIVIPTMCIVYSRRYLSGQRLGFLFTIYHSLLITFPYLIWFLGVNKTIVYSFILFVWCEIWGLIGLINIKLKRKKDT